MKKLASVSLFPQLVKPLLDLWTLSLLYTGSGAVERRTAAGGKGQSDPREQDTESHVSTWWRKPECHTHRLTSPTVWKFELKVFFISQPHTVSIFSNMYISSLAACISAMEVFAKLQFLSRARPRKKFINAHAYIYTILLTHAFFASARMVYSERGCGIRTELLGEALSISTKDASQDVLSQRFWDGARVGVEPRLRHAVDPVSSFSPRSHG